jgi:hypothetical protein
MRQILVSLAIAFPSLCWPATAVRATMIVEAAFHNCRAVEHVAPYEQGFEYFDLPAPSPYVLNHTASLPPSYCAANYASSWSNDGGVFHVETSQHLQGFIGDTNTIGWYLIRPSVDSILSVTGLFNYDHFPSQLGQASFFFRVRRDGGPFIFGSGGSDGTFNLGQPSGALSVSGFAQLQAGIRYKIDYAFSTDNFDPPPADAVWVGDGGFTFTINPVPEPSATLLLLPAALYPARRIRHTSRRL